MEPIKGREGDDDPRKKWADWMAREFAREQAEWRQVDRDNARDLWLIPLVVFVFCVAGVALGLYLRSIQ